MNSHVIVSFLVIPFEALQLDRDFRKINLTRPFLSEKANNILFVHSLGSDIGPLEYRILFQYR